MLKKGGSENLPLIRKIIPIGNSKAITIPKSWLEYYEKQQGQPIDAVAIEVNKILKVTPMPHKK